MRWAVVETGDAVHVVPEADAGEHRFFHALAAECICGPAIEQHRVPLVAHRALSDIEHRRNVLRAWNLRRMLRGRRAARWLR